MDVEQYRKQYQEQLERAAQQQTSYRDLLGSSKSAPMVLGLEGSEAGEQDEVAELIKLIRNKDEDVALRIRALDAISREAGAGSGSEFAAVAHPQRYCCCFNNRGDLAQHTDGAQSRLGPAAHELLL